MIISQTPYRISLFGGSTDYESYYTQYGSLLLGFTMNKFCYLCVRKTPPIYDCHSRINYALTEKVSSNKEIKHNGVRGVLDFLDIDYGLEINHMADLPSQTGIGSSSSFIVGLLNSMNKINRQSMNPKQLARNAIFIERTLLAEPGGIQDQIWAAYGGFNSIDIDTEGDFEVKPLPVSQDFIYNFFNHCCLVYTGNSRESFKLAEEASSKNADSYKKVIHDISKEAYSAFCNKDIGAIAELLKHSWEEKRKISKNISNNNINEIYDNLLKNNMVGGKLLGSGGSGFIFAIFDNKYSKKKYMINNERNCLDVTYSNEGSIIK